MAWPMMEWVLDTHYPHLFVAAPPEEETIITEGAGEGDLIELMNDIVARLSGFEALQSASIRRGQSAYHRAWNKGKSGSCGRSNGQHKNSGL